MKNNIAILSGVKVVNGDVARALSEALGMLVLDTDDYIAYAMELDLNQIISDYGAEFFYRIESKKLAKLIEYEDAVIATSPTCILNPDNIRTLNEFSYTVLLKCDPELEWERFHSDDTLVMRPHLSPVYSKVIQGKAEIERMRLVDIVVDITSLNIASIVSEIMFKFDEIINRGV